jgi:hypothetical protein
MEFTLSRENATAESLTVVNPRSSKLQREIKENLGLHKRAHRFNLPKWHFSFFSISGVIVHPVLKTCPFLRQSSCHCVRNKYSAKRRGKLEACLERM